MRDELTSEPEVNNDADCNVEAYCDPLQDLSWGLAHGGLHGLPYTHERTQMEARQRRDQVGWKPRISYKMEKKESQSAER